MSKKFPGQVWGRNVEARFAFSGKLVSLRKNVGDGVNKGEIIASLDRLMLQADLDRQLAQNSQVRADFEIFNIRFKNPGDDITRYNKSSVQAALDASVKEVEQAKYRLDQADLISPVTGIVLDTGGCVVGLNVTPAANSVVILDTVSIVFRIKVEPHDNLRFANPVKLPIDLTKIGKKIFGQASLPKMLASGDWVVDLAADELKDLPVGLGGSLLLESD